MKRLFLFISFLLIASSAYATVGCGATAGGVALDQSTCGYISTAQAYADVGGMGGSTTYTPAGTNAAPTVNSLTAALFVDVVANVSTQSGTKNSCTYFTAKIEP